MKEGQLRYKQNQSHKSNWMQPKQLMLIPSRVAIALQEGVWMGKAIRSQEDACWFAGLIDSDGVIGIYKSHGYNGLRIQVMVTDKETIDHICKITNFGKTYKHPRKTVADKSVYVWKCQGKIASNIIHDIYPYLICKKKQALVGWNFYLLQKEKGLEFEEGKKYGNEFGRPKMANKLLLKRKKLAEISHKLNQREDVNCNGLYEPNHPIKGGGWILRNTIIWHKPNPMPSSVKDRLNNTFEHVFHFVKSRKYYYDLDAIREPHNSIVDLNNRKNKFWSDDIAVGGSGKQNCGRSREDFYSDKGKNPGNFWDIATKPFTSYSRDLEHFAVFPEELLIKPLKSSCPRLVCKKCGKPKQQIAKTGGFKEAFNIRVRDVKEKRIKHTDRKASDDEVENYNEGEYVSKVKDRVISPGCKCNAGFEPGIVLDPFAGRGTTGKIAKKLGLRYILFDIKPEYCELAQLYINGQKRKLIKYQRKLII